jgi:resuscitation-promoting factor RpfB
MTMIKTLSVLIILISIVFCTLPAEAGRPMRWDKIAQLPEIIKIEVPQYYEWTVEATAYTHTGNATACGIYPYEGVIAAPPEIPFGTKVYVPGYGEAVVCDRGGAIYGNIIDLFYDSEGKCMAWGRRVVTIRVYYR